MTTAGVILAGGRGQRMGGEDKGTVTYKGRPLVEHVIAKLAPQLDQLVISANRNIDFYKQYDYPVLADDIGDYWGPLAGIATAMKFCQSDLLLISPCDTPNLPDNLLQRLTDVMEEKRVDVVMAQDEDHLHPVITLVKCSLYDDLVAYLRRGERKAMKWMQSQNWAATRFPDQADCFANINSLDDIDQTP
ncbi:MAG: molybdenum cofactor guanylyltransferase [Proteobacteria bacterium]|nr:molybdenum cofactor guanylyltransferase [Pseudomonadota bacterium]